MQRATKGNLKNIIIDAILSSADEYYEMAGVPIYKAPEYFLNVNVAKTIAEQFPKVGYRLEMQVKELMSLFDISDKEVLNPDLLRFSGNFDLLLISRDNLKPRHVIELKRHLGRRAMKIEARRIAALCIQNHFRKQLKTGFIVTISRIKSKTSRAIPADEKIESRIDDVQDEIANLGNFSVSGLYYHCKNGEYGYGEHESLLVSVIEIKLLE
ncbi:hypothetical protein GCM10009092_02100 [Bowmanella denitrificans]|uniref:Uncharacterized protein n=1 Tax=Bowmanella denitrificans TaxID=366582 RepID=A0ABN0WLD2_9ALTE